MLTATGLARSSARVQRLVASGSRNKATSAKSSRVTKAATEASKATPHRADSSPRVVYRGPPGLKTWLYYFMGTVFTGASCYQGYALSQHLSWPIFSTDYEKNPPKVVSPFIRYPAGVLAAMVGGGLGLFVMWNPTRIITRVTIYPKTAQVGIRSAARPFRAFLPSSLRPKKYVPLSPQDTREQLYPLDALFRRDPATAVGIDAAARGQAPRVVDAKGRGGFKRVPTSLLLGEKDRLGYQLEAAPQVQPTVIETQSPYRRGWNRFKQSIKGNTDWSLAPGQVGFSEAEQKAKYSLRAKEPWFLDRSNFDRLFPYDS